MMSASARPTAPHRADRPGTTGTSDPRTPTAGTTQPVEAPEPTGPPESTEAPETEAPETGAAGGVAPPPDSGGELRAVARSGGVSLIGAVTASVLGFLVVVQVSRGLGAAGAGAFSVAVAVTMTLSVIGRFGTDTALVRTLPRLRALGRDADLRAAAAAALVPVCVGTTVLAAALWWAAPLVAGLVFDQPRPEGAAQLIRVSAAAIPLSAAGFVALAITRGLGTVVPLTLVESVAKPILRCGCVALVLLLGAGVHGVTAAWAAPAAVGAVLAGVLAWRALRAATDDTSAAPTNPAAPTGAAPREPGGAAATRRELWRFAAPRAAAAACEIGGMHVGIVLVSALSGVEEAGVYNAVLRIALAGTLALQALRLAIAPRLSHLLTAGDPEGVERVHRVATVWITLLSFPLYLVLASWPGLILVVFGPGFPVGGPALTVLAVAMLVNLATGTVSTVLLMSGRSGLTLAVTAVSLTVGAALTVVLAPRYGVMGAAVAKALSVVFENVAATVLVRRTTRVRTLSPPLALAVVAALACFALPPGALRLVEALAGTDTLPGVGVPVGGPLVATVTVLVGVAAYLAVLWRWREPFHLAALTALLPGRLRPRSAGAPPGR